MKSLRMPLVILALLALVTAISTTSVMGRNKVVPVDSGNDVYIINHMSLPMYTPELFYIQDYSQGHVIQQGSLVDPDNMNTPIMLIGQNSKTPYPGQIWAFYLHTNQRAKFFNYSQTNPFHCSIWCPVDSSNNGQSPSAAGTAYCFSGVSPSTQMPVAAGNTLVEPILHNASSDTIDISEVSGVNAQWAVLLPNNGWSTSAYSYSSGGKTPNQVPIPVRTIMNQPGSSYPFYGDYGNPGVYPYGCTNCASRYNNPTAPGTPPGTFGAGCPGLLTYPSNDVGCDNAINYYPNNGDSPFTYPLTAPLSAYESAPPGRTGLPTDATYSPHHKLFDLSTLSPVPGGGYGICQLSRTGHQLGGKMYIYLQQYPFGQTTY